MKLTIVFPVSPEYRSLATACQSTPPPEGSHLLRSKPDEKRLKKIISGLQREAAPRHQLTTASPLPSQQIMLRQQLPL